MLPLYILTLGVSSGLVGVFGRRLLAAQGFVPGFDTGLTVALGIGAAYAAVQLLYMAAVRLLAPTREGAPLFAESLSQSAAVILVPFLIHFPIPWPYAILAKIEPLIYLGAFGGVHAFFKLFSFFCAIQSRPSGRLGFFGWVGASAACVCVTYSCFLSWYGALLEGREVTPEEMQPYCLDGVYAPARRMPEGAVYRFDLVEPGERNLTLRWANPPEQEPPSETIYVTVRTDGTHAKPFLLHLELEQSAWTELRIPPSEIPADATNCTLLWSQEKDPDWVVQTGLRPVAASDRVMLVAGPYPHQIRTAASPPNVLMIVVEGLTAENMSGFGYSRATTPSLAALAERSLSFPYGYTPAPEAPAACMTLLTGASPLEHGYLGVYQGLLPETLQTLPEALSGMYYATAAFTEGTGPDGDDLFYGSGFERGFEVFDAHYPLVTPASAGATPVPAAQVPAGSRITLDKAADWIEAHHDEQFMVFVRLRELRSPQRLNRYGEGFLGRGREPMPVDIYDTALADVDLRIGAFLDRIKNVPEMENTVVVVTSSNGFDFSEPGRGIWRRGGEAKRNLSESALRVPLLISAPGVTPRERIMPVGLENVLPTLLGFIGAKVTQTLEGTDLLGKVSGEAISMLGEPLALSIRSQNWRYTWQSGLAPFSNKPLEAASVIELVDMNRYRWGKVQPDNLSREPLVARQYQDTLRDYAKKHIGTTTFQ